MNRRSRIALRASIVLSLALAVLASSGCREEDDSAGAPVPAATPPPATDPADWCAPHAIPESMCTKCNPHLIDGFKASGDWCPEHGYPESACPLCNPMDPPGEAARPAAVAEGTRIRFAAPHIERAAGIETAAATVDAIGGTIDCTARIDFDRDRLAEVRSPVPGIVRRVTAELGQRVTAGEALFTLESARIGDLQTRLQAAREEADAARSNYERQQKLRQDAISSKRQVELARQDLQAAEARLRSIEQSLKMSGAARSARVGRFRVTAPIDGVVVRRSAVLGTFAGGADPLATVVDTSVMWALLAVPEWDAAALRPGQAADVQVDGVAGRTFTGTITWVSAEVDARTRTVAARVEVPNPDGLLRAGQFARARIQVAAARDAISVPLEAVQRVDDGSVVFVRLADGTFEPRVVQLGRADGRRVQVSGELEVGDRIATTGAFLLRTELSRESIGAGCCEVEPRGEK